MVLILVSIGHNKPADAGAFKTIDERTRGFNRKCHILPQNNSGANSLGEQATGTLTKMIADFVGGFPKESPMKFPRPVANAAWRDLSNESPFLVASDAL